MASLLCHPAQSMPSPATHSILHPNSHDSASYTPASLSCPSPFSNPRFSSPPSKPSCKLRSSLVFGELHRAIQNQAHALQACSYQSQATRAAKGAETSRSRHTGRSLLQRGGRMVAASAGRSEVADSTEQREQQFFQMLQVPEEQRRAVEQQQLMDRAAAALAAAQSLLAETGSQARLERQMDRGRPNPNSAKASSWLGKVSSPGGYGRGGSSPSSPNDSASREASSAPGPDFWNWVPPPKDSAAPSPSPSTPSPAPVSAISQQSFLTPKPAPTNPLQRSNDGGSSGRGGVAVMDRSSAQASPTMFSIPLQSQQAMQAGVSEDLAFLLAGKTSQASLFELPPMKSLVEAETTSFLGLPSQLEEAVEEQQQEQPQEQQAEQQQQQQQQPQQQQVSLASRPASPSGQDSGVSADGARWWREWGTEDRGNGEICEWTVVRAVSADGSVESEEKWWEASDPFEYKEMGAVKSGRDSRGNVWRETWREAMWQDSRNGLPHIEKSADKWGKTSDGGEWHEKWWEHYDGSGKAEKSADKWSKIDVNTILDAGHAHVWHETWGEEYDGKGAASKYCDKWAERYVGDGLWTKWGDKWDEKFDRNSHGFRQGETWWEGAHEGERWNQSWSEGHNGSGWVHKQGRSSSGEHWDVHEPMDTWYERRPHYGFKECLDQSRRLRKVGKPKRRL